LRVLVARKHLDDLKMATWTMVSAVVLVLALFGSTSADVGDACGAESVCEARQVCNEAGKCECDEGHTSFGGYCIRVRGHGQTCSDLNECISSGDPNLHCSPDRRNVNRCQCRTGFEYFSEDKRCYPNGVDRNKHSAIAQFGGKPKHVGFKKVDPIPKAHDTPVILEHNLTQLYDKHRNHKKRDPVEAKVIGPASVVVAAVILFAVCVCFWSVKNPDAAREDTYAVSRSESSAVDAERGGGSGPDGSTYRSAKSVDDEFHSVVGAAQRPTSSTSSAPRSASKVSRAKRAAAELAKGSIF